LIRYIDTSVLVAYYLPEPLSGSAERNLRRGGTPAISPLVEVEFASVLARKVRTRELALATARAALEQFRAHLEEGLYRRLEIGSAHYAQAQRWVEALNRRCAPSTPCIFRSQPTRVRNCSPRTYSLPAPRVRCIWPAGCCVPERQAQSRSPAGRRALRCRSGKRMIGVCC